MIPLPGGSSPFLFLPSKLRHPASQPVHSPPPTTPPAVVQTGCRPNRGHTTAFVSREDAKTRRETQWSSARGQIGRRWAGAVDTPPRSSHAKTRRREEKRSGRRRGGQIRPVIARNDGERERRGAGTHHTSIAASHTTLQKHTIQPVHTVQPAYTIQPLHNTLEPGETI